MRKLTQVVTCIITLLALAPGQQVAAQVKEEQIVQAATSVFNETMASPMNKIPQAMLTDAHGVAIIPNVIKGGFVVGARRGRGLLFVREADGVWHAPVFITLTGGNIGWQAGIQSSDVVLVFKTQRSVQAVLAGKMTIGADAAAAAGPIGRQGGIATDGSLMAEIFSYSRSRGLFAGVSIDGSVVRVDQLSTGTYYGNPAPGQPVSIPVAAQKLTQAIATYAASTPVAAANTVASKLPTTGQQPTAAPQPSLTQQPGTIQQPDLVHQHSSSEADVLRAQLAQIAPKLYELLDEQWKSYLALPSSFFLGGPHPNEATLQATMKRFETVTTNPQFNQLATRPEFQSVYGILKHYQLALAAKPTDLQLPPPPTISQIPADLK